MVPPPYNKMYSCRVDLPPQSTWWASLPANIVPKLVHYESTPKSHYHAILSTSLNQTRLNKELRRVTELTERMAIQTSKLEEGELTRAISYIRKDGDERYCSSDFVDVVKEVVPQVRKPKVIKEEKPIKEKKEKWSLYVWLYETARDLVDTKIRDRKEGTDMSYQYVKDQIDEEYRNSIRAFALDLNKLIFENKKDHWTEPFRVSNIHGYYGYIQTIHARLFRTSQVFDRAMPPSWN